MSRHVAFIAALCIAVALNTAAGSSNLILFISSVIGFVFILPYFCFVFFVISTIYFFELRSFSNYNA
jgi:hypothetical protein